jgi:GxxExxY protein
MLFASLAVMTTPNSFAHGEITGAVIEGFVQTYEELGSGFAERVCVKALAIVLRERGLRVWTNAPIAVLFHKQRIGRFYADMVVNETVLLEIKSSQPLDGYAQAQLLNYLKAAGGGVGLLLNFGRRPEHKRMVMGDPFDSLPLLRRSEPNPT